MRFEMEWSSDPTFVDEGHITNDVFGFAIKEREGECPKAVFTLLLSNAPKVNDAVRLIKNEGMLSTTVFEGKCVSLTSQKSGAFCDIDCVGHNKSVQDALEEIRDDLNRRDNHDPLLVKRQPDGKPSLKELLLFHDHVPFVSRDLKTVNLVSLNGEDGTVDLTKSVFADSLILSAGKAIGKSIQISASWVETYWGTTDVSAAIREKLPVQCIETFTGKSLKSRWWKTDAIYGLDGYRVYESDLLYRGKGRSISVDAESDDAITSIRYKPQLSLAWRYRQPRREILTIGDPLATKTVKITIRGLTKTQSKRSWRPDTYYKKREYVSYKAKIYMSTNSHRSSEVFESDHNYWQESGNEDDFQTGFAERSFFQSDRGKACLESLKRVRCNLESHNQRHAVVKFQCTGSVGVTLSVNTRVRIKDPRLSGDDFVGKVIALKTFAHGKTGQFYSYLTLVPLVDTGVNDVPVVATCLASEERDREPRLFTAHELVKEVAVIDDAEDQVRYFEDATVSKIPGTRVRLRLENLTEKDTITNYFQLGEA